MANRFRKNIISFQKPTPDKVIRFENDGRTFGALYQAEGWLIEHGYHYGSLCVPSLFIAAQKGEYTLPQKIYNMDKEDKVLIDAVICSRDYREGSVEVWLLK